MVLGGFFILSFLALDILMRYGCDDYLFLSYSVLPLSQNGFGLSPIGLFI